MKNTTNKKMTKNTAKKFAVALGTAVASSSVFAADGDTSITTAIASGQASVELVVAGVIAMSALAFGLTMIVSWLRK